MFVARSLLGLGESTVRALTDQHQYVTYASSGVLPLHMVDEATVERNLLTAGLPDPDILIRTSGEKRVRRKRRGRECHIDLL